MNATRHHYRRQLLAMLKTDEPETEPEPQPKAEPHVDVALAGTGGLPFAKFQNLMAMDPKFAGSWEHQRPDMSDQSLSSFDMSLVSCAVHAGWSDGELADLIAEHRKKYDPDDTKAMRHDYINRTVAKARSSFVLQSVATSGDRESILSQVSERLGFTVTGLTQLLSEPPEWILKTADYGDVTIGDANALRILTKFETAVMGTTKRLLHMSAVEWREVLASLLQIAEDQPCEEGTDAGVIEEWLYSYCTTHENKEYFDGLPGRPAVSLSRLQMHLGVVVSRFMAEISPRWWGKVVRKMGFRKGDFRHGKLHWRAWRFPDAWDFTMYETPTDDEE